jgi:DNA-binding transcriptional regulator YiaG
MTVADPSVTPGAIRSRRWRAKHASRRRHIQRIALSDGERQRLRTLRRSAHIPRKELARQIGISPSALNKWEWGYRRPTAAQHLGWLAALGRGSPRSEMTAPPAGYLPAAPGVLGG